MAAQPPRPTIRIQQEQASSSTTQRRITLKINPQKAKVQTVSSPSIAHPPTNATQDSQPNDEERRPRPMIRIKPLRQTVDVPKAQEEPMIIDTPVREPSPAAVASPVDVVTPAPQPVITESFLPPATPIKLKAPRPVKLKPLKEVLQRLITQIKRKDAYAFFLQPVDTDQVPGYLDVVKTPMDFGTMTEKVEKGRYRSLEQFKDDFLLVTSNAKTFNPPSTMYHTEASKIEALGLEQIARASTQVIEYEADWSVDVVADGEPMSTVDQDEANATPGGDDIGRAGPSRARSPSVLSSAAGISNMLIERSRRAKSKKIPVVTENFEEGWHLPGYKDGVGVFSPCSPLANLMLELKLIGKKWTKKERLKREKDGPPYTPEGSLDYYELQQPFSIFNNLLPDVPKAPEVIPLVSSTTIEAGRDTPEASQPPDDRTVLQPSRGPPEPVAIPLDVLSSIFDEPGKYAFTDPPSSMAQIGGKKLRHWTITRNPPRGTRVREDEDDGLATYSAKRRRVESTDFGSFATLIGTVAAENGLKASDFERFLGQDEQLLDQIRQGIENSSYRAASVDDELVNADAFLRDTVYGGVDGLAYFRSLAEFVGERPAHVSRAARKHGTNTEDIQTGSLGTPLSRWALENILDPLSHGNHSVLRTASSILASSRASPKEAEHALANFITKLSCNLYEQNSLDVSALATIRTQLLELKELEDPDAKIEIAEILRAPDELFLAESAWAGNPPVATQAPSDPTIVPVSSSVAPGAENSPMSTSFAANGTPNDPTSAIGAVSITSAEPASGGGLAAPSLGNTGTDNTSITSVSTVLTPSTTTNPIDRALIVSADALRMLSERASSMPSSTASLPADRPTPAPADSDTTLAAATPATSTDDSTSATEDPITRQTRLGLIALAKRAPIDRIARLPPELVPVHIRHIVPTLGS